MKTIAYREKHYVEVISSTDANGKTIPLAIVWDSGKQYQIDRILDQRKACSLKCGGVGIRYTVQINGVATYLFWEDPKWFVEAKVASL